MIVSIVCFVISAIMLICLVISEIDWLKKVNEQMQKYPEDGWYDRRFYAKKDVGAGNGFDFFVIMLLFLAWGIFLFP